MKNKIILVVISLLLLISSCGGDSSRSLEELGNIEYSGKYAPLLVGGENNDIGELVSKVTISELKEDWESYLFNMGVGYSTDWYNSKVDLKGSDYDESYFSELFLSWWSFDDIFKAYNTEWKFIVEEKVTEVYDIVATDVDSLEQSGTLGIMYIRIEYEDKSEKITSIRFDLFINDEYTIDINNKGDNSALVEIPAKVISIVTGMEEKIIEDHIRYTINNNKFNFSDGIYINTVRDESYYTVEVLFFENGFVENLDYDNIELLKYSSMEFENEMRSLGFFNS